METQLPSTPSDADISANFTADTAAASTTTTRTMADPFEKEKAVLKDIRIINLAWFIDIKYRFWTPGEMIRIPEDQQAYYISVLHDFPNIIRNVPAIPTGFHHDTSRVRCATESEIDRWLLARQKANTTRGIEALQAMMPSLWQMMDDHSRQNPSLNDTQILQSLTSKSSGIPPNLVTSAAANSKNTSDIPASTPRNIKTPKK